MALPLVPLIVIGVTSIATAALTTKDKPVQSSKPNQRRTKDDYSGTSFDMLNTYKMRPIQPIQPIQPMSTIQPVQTIQQTQALKPIEPIDPHGYQYMQDITRGPIYNYYTDPYQVNSLADVVFNREGKNLVLEDLDMEWATYIPGLQELIVGVDYLKRSYVDPFKEKGWGGFVDAGINALQATSEDLDVITNPIKGLFIDGPKGIIRGLGIGNEGRTQYDFNAKTGLSLNLIPDDLNLGIPIIGPLIGQLDNLDFYINLAGEIFADPLNWATLGTKELAQQGVKEVSQEAIERVAKNNAAEITEEVAKQYNKNVQVITTKMLRDKAITGTDVVDIVKNLNVSPATKNVLLEETANLIKIISERKIITSSVALYKKANKIDSAIMAVTPLGLTLRTGKKIINFKDPKSLAGWLTKKYTKTFDKINLDTSKTLNVTYDAELLKEVQTFNNTLKVSYSKEVLPNFENLTKIYRKVASENEEVSMDIFLKQLVNDKIITSDAANRMLIDPEFYDYYSSIAQKVTVVDTLHQSILRSGELVNAAVEEAIIKSTTTHEALENVAQVYRECLGLDESYGLASIRDAIKKQIRDAKKKVKDLKLRGASLEEIVIAETKLTTLKNVLEDYSRQTSILGVPLDDLVNVPSGEILRAIKNKTPEDASQMLKFNYNATEASVNELQSVNKTIKKEMFKLRKSVSKLVNEMDKYYDSLKEELQKQLDIKPAITSAGTDDVLKNYFKQANEELQKHGYVFDGNHILEHTPNGLKVKEAATHTDIKIFRDAKTMRALDNVYVIFDNLQRLEAMIKDLSNGVCKDSILTDLDNLAFELPEKYSKIIAQARVAAEEFIENRDTINQYRRILRDLKRAQEYVSKPLKKDVFVPSDTTKTFKIMNKYANNNADMLLRRLLNTNDIETLFEHKSISDEMKVQASEVMERYRATLRADIKAFMEYIEKEYTTLEVHNTQEIIQSFYEKYADEIMNWDVLSHDYHIISAIETKGVDNITHATAFDEYIKMSDDYKKYVRKTYEEMKFNNVMERIADYENADSLSPKDIPTTYALEIDNPKDLRIYENLKDNTLNTSRDIENAINAINDIGDVKYSVEDFRSEVLGHLIPESEVMYSFKMNQAKIHQMLLEPYESNPTQKQFISDLAFGTNNTVAGAVFNYLATADTADSMLSFSRADIINLKEIAKAHVAYTELWNEVLLDVTKSNPELGLAFIDAFAGLGYKDKIKVIEDLMPYGEIDVDKLYDFINLRYNNIANQFTKTNEVLAEKLDIDVDNLRLHDASVDIEVSEKVHAALINKGAMPMPKDGDIFTYYDLETTGLNTDGYDHILQVAAHKVQVQNGEFVSIADPLNIFIKREKGYKIDASALEKFDQLFLDNSNKATTSLDEAMDALFEYSEGTVVGHNIKKFDNRMVEHFTGKKMSEYFRVQDTLEAASKIYGAKDIDDNILRNIKLSLEKYLNTIGNLSTVKQTVNLIDAKVANKLFDVSRDISDIIQTTGAKDFKEYLSQNLFTKAMEGILGKTDLTTIAKETGPVTNSEFLDAVSAIDISKSESITKQIRDSLSLVKSENSMFREYIITKEMLEELQDDIVIDFDIGMDYQLKLNIVGLTNNIIEGADGKLHLTDKFQFSNLSVRKISTEEYTSSLKRKVQTEITEPMETRQAIIEALDKLESPNTDWMTKYEASQTLAAYGTNYTQADRLRAAVASASAHATSPHNLSDGIKRNIAIGNNEIKEHLDYAHDWAMTATKLDNKTYKKLNKEICINDTLGTLAAGMTPEQFTAFLTDKAGGLGYIGDINHPAYKHYVEAMMANESAYNAVGYTFRRKGDGLFILPVDREKVIANSKAVKGEYGLKHIKRPHTDEVVNELFEKSEAIHAHYYRLTGEKPIKSPHDFASKLMYSDNFYAIKRGREDIFAGTLLADEEWVSMYYSSRVPRYSYGILGSLEGRRVLDDYYPQPLNNNITMIDKAIRRVDGRNKFIELYFNNDLSINSTFYKGLSNQDILDMYNSLPGDNVFMILVADNKTKKPIVKTFRPSTIDDIKWLKKMDGVLSPTYNANSIMSSINKSVFENKFDFPLFQLYYKYVVSTYKSIALTTSGLLVRNTDDVVIKNAMDGNLDEVPESMKQFLAGVRDWNEYNRMYAEIESIYTNVNKQTIDDYFNGIAVMEGADVALKRKSLFEELSEYSTSNVSAGMATAQEEMLMQFYNKYGARSDLSPDEWFIEGKKPSKFDKWFFEENTFRKINKFVMDKNTIIEHGGRIANLRMSRAKGLNDYEAFNEVLRTHFDYGTKSRAQMYAELIFPFVNFPLFNNIYWSEQIYKNPQLVELILDASRSSLDIEQQKQYTLDNGKYLQSLILNGNVRVGNTITKINPSLFDAFNLVSNPVDTFKNRMGTVPKNIIDMVLEGTGHKKIFNPDPEDEEYVSKNDTNLNKIGLGKVEEQLNIWGLYSVTRLANNVLKGVAYLDKDGDLERTDSIADIIPSLYGEYNQNYGARIGEDFATYRYTTPTSTVYDTVQTATGRVVSTKAYPKKTYSKGSSGGYSRTPGRSYKRIPYVRRYYSNSYNWYNRWKAERVNPYRIQQPATPESLAYTFKGLLYDLDMNPKILRAYDRKQNQVLKVK